MKLVAQEKGSTEEFAPLAARFYRAKLVSIEEYFSEYYKQNRLKWKFEITEDGSALGRWVWGRTGDKMGYTQTGQPTKPRRWFSAVIGEDLEDGEEVDVDLLLGTECIVNVVAEKADDGKINNRVENVINLSEFLKSMEILSKAPKSAKNPPKDEDGDDIF